MEVRSDRERTGSPRASAQDLTTLVLGNNAFALDLYRALSEGEGNLFFSPFSVSQALAMTLAGARGETERQMMNTLHYELPQGRLHPTFNALDRELASRGRGLQGQENQFFQLNIANAIWGQQGYEFLPTFSTLWPNTMGRVSDPWTSRAPRRIPGPESTTGSPMRRRARSRPFAARDGRQPHPSSPHQRHILQCLMVMALQ